MKEKLRAIWQRIRQNKHFWKNFLLFAGALFIIFISTVTFWISSFRIPDFHAFEDRKVINSTKIYDRTGEVLLYDIHQDVKRTNIPFEEMSPYIKNATVAIEDSEFYNHGGIRVTSIIRAVLANALGTGRTQGGSTITQQLVKNALLTQEKSYTRKIKEWVLAIKIDRSLPKDKILEYYLNEAPYGGNIYGIEEASKTYYGKAAADLTLAEAAYLAAIPQSPSVLSPYGRNRQRLEDRKNLVLSRMHELGFITDGEYAASKSEVVAFLPQATQGIRAPHFVFFIKQYLEEKYGSELVENGGLNVITTIDADLQQKAEDIVKEGALQNEKDWGGENAALVAIDPKTGQILSMVGSRDYFDKEIDGNFNVATANRQPGSSFKPFIYATAFNKGFTPDTVLFDLPTEFQTTCDAYGKAVRGSQSDCYMPQDYDGKYRGPMSLRNALAQSINIPAVKLFYLAGLRDSLQTAEEMGITTLTDPSRYGLTLVIGGGEVTPLDIASAYSVFANDGIRNPYTGIMQVKDVSGRILEEFAPDPKEVLPKNTALTISDILSDNVARTPTFGSNSPLNIPGHDVAVKTGTTNNNKDAWTIGYTPSIAVAVWAGNNDNKAMKKGGSAVAGPIWNKFMNEALKVLPNDKFEAPDLSVDPTKVKPVLRGQWLGNESFFVDKISGKLATPDTPAETREEHVVTNVHSILYWVDRNDITGPAPAHPEDNPQFSHWEIPVQNWWASHSGSYPTSSWISAPTESDDVHTGTSRPVLTITEPDATTLYPKDQKINLRVNSSGTFPLKKIDVFVNNTYLGTTEAPFNFSFIPEDLDNLRDQNTIEVIGYDEAFNRGEVSSTFEVDN
jgi:1A family penicillin-binding protein